MCKRKDKIWHVLLLLDPTLLLPPLFLSSSQKCLIPSNASSGQYPLDQPLCEAAIHCTGGLVAFIGEMSL